MQRIPPELTQNARRLRREATPAERLLWNALRSHRPRFTRQLVVGHFIVDLACRSVRIGVELDGGHHAVQIDADEARSRYLATQGWTILRFWNNEVLENVEGVVEVILTAVAQAATHPQPLACREGS
ncbi:DUF559 domain-containing protein [uncultured Sphingomonas sp.]|uniref:endonuclease domain-containing protein n=1 Tax=uncultured Sphingomonas sp. TaxID=158754 RepID=UPI0030F5D6A6